MIARLTHNLTLRQSACVAIVFLFTLCGALLLAWGFVKWNQRHA